MSTSRNNQFKKQNKQGQKASASVSQAKRQKAFQRARSQRPMQGLSVSDAGGRARIGRSQRLVVPITHEEYVGDVVLSSAGFTNVQYQVNPGNATTFPLLSGIASKFQKYWFSKLRFRFIRAASQFATAGQTGDIILSWDDNATNPQPASLQQALNYRDKTGDIPSQNLVLPISLDQLQRMQDGWYVLPGAQPANTDLKTYNIGALNVSTSGTASSGTAGRLMVEYTCHLTDPITTGSASAGGTVHFSAITATTAANLSSMVLQAGGTPALTGITMTGSTITFPVGLSGNYIVLVGLQGATSATAIGYSSVTGGVTPLSLMTNAVTRDSVSYMVSLAGTGGNDAMWAQAVTLSGAGGTLVMTASTIVGNGCGDVWIFSMPSTVLTTPAHPIEQLRLRLARLESALEESKSSHVPDSDFESERCQPSPNPPPLTASLVGAIGEYMSRKSTMANKSQ